MYNTIAIKSDYSLLKSLIKIPDLVSFCVKNNIKTIGLLDDNLFGTIEFYDECIKNNIKPIIGLECIINELSVYLYAKNYDGYKSLLKINTIKQQRALTVCDLKEYNYEIIVVIPYNSTKLYESLKHIYKDVYVSYQNEFELKNASIITDKIIPLNIVRSFNINHTKYYNILDKIRDDNETLKEENSYLIKIENTKVLNEFINKINIVIDKSKRYIPKYKCDIEDTYVYLKTLVNKGLSKRLKGNITSEYQKRLDYELSVIKDMGFVDYFLIVYDYVKYAKTHDILVGLGRGSAAGSLVSYCLGITNIDPIKYNLLFERFLNPGRITMPDIDVDFEDVKREQVITYIKEKYGSDYVAPIMTFGTLSARLVLKSVAKSLDMEEHIDILTKNIDPKENLENNLKNKEVNRLLNLYPELKNIYHISMKLEGLKKFISTHAAGVVISSSKLDDIIPIYKSGDTTLTGVTMNYLEELGILKMDVLAITNLTIIHNILNLIKEDINLNEIPLDDKKVYNLFSKGLTDGVFQFESSGMKSFLQKLKPTCFSDLYAAIALFRPGPMGNIDKFIKRKNGLEKIVYFDDKLKDIFEETYGIMIYQEQIINVLVKMGNYTYSQADNIRKAMSKKKEEIIIKEKDNFIKKSIENGYTKEKAMEVYELILKFANYGFNKSHSVSYALIGYQMAYLKVHYPNYFIANLLNMNINSEEKTKEYLSLAKKYNIEILKPMINLSQKEYKIGINKLRLPLGIIKNVGEKLEDYILEESKKKPFSDFVDFVIRTYGNINKKVIESLIYAGAFDIFKVNRKTLINNLDNVLKYAKLGNSLDDFLVDKPILEEYDEYTNKELINQEYNSYGFYITNHPASIYNTKDIVKLSQVRNFFNKFIKCVVIINNVREIKTKKGDRMAFIKASDETASLEFVLFPKEINYLKEIKINDLVLINGSVQRRYDEYQININKVTKL